MPLTYDIITADIGGTNARFASFKVCISPRFYSIQKSIRLISSEYPSFGALVESAIDKLDCRFDMIAIAVPGSLTTMPVFCPNLKWMVDINELDYDPIALINDFVAQGWAVTMPSVQNLQHICGPDPNERRKVAENSIMAVIGGGTGLGCCCVKNSKDHPFVLASELGHTLLPLGVDFYAYAQFLKKKHIRPDGDNLLSGRGISHLCEFCTGQILLPSAASQHLSPEMWTILSTLYAYACQQVILTYLPLGGLFLTGGVLNAHPGIVESPVFKNALYDCPHLEHIIYNTPISLVRNDESALWGAAACAVNLILEKEIGRQDA